MLRERTVCDLSRRRSELSCRMIQHSSKAARRHSYRRTKARAPSSFAHVQKLAAIIVALGFLFWLWFGASTHHAPRASYPYYDTHKPVPPWSEPMPLEGNHDREGEYK